MQSKNVRLPDVALRWMKAARASLRNAWYRLGSGLAAYVALAVFLWPSDNWSFDAAQFAAVCTALAAWAVGLIMALQPPLAALDLQLIDRFRQTADDQLLDELHNHEFGSQVPEQLIDKVRSLSSDWDGVRSEFLDPSLVALFGEVKVQANNLSTLLATLTEKVEGREGLYTVRYQRGPHRYDDERERSNAHQLNRAAAALGKAVDAFEREVRRRH